MRTARDLLSTLLVRDYDSTGAHGNIVVVFRALSILDGGAGVGQEMASIQVRPLIQSLRRIQAIGGGELGRAA